MHISFDLQQAFQQVGNAISPVHAWIQLAKTHVLLGPLSMFRVGVDKSVVLKSILAKAIKLSAFQPDFDGSFEFLKPVVEEIEDDLSPQPKRPKTGSVAPPEVSPTIPFKIDAGGSAEVGTAHRDVEPRFVIDKTNVTALHGFCKGGIMFFKHFQNNWLMVIHGSVDEKLGSYVCRALPHATISHFLAFQCRGKEVLWDEVLTFAPPATVTFQPQEISVNCALPGESQVTLNADVTWTIRTVLAFLGAHLKCNVDALRVYFQGLPINECDFVTEFKDPNFQVQFKACQPGYTALSLNHETTKEAGMIPAHNGCIRFVAKHPAHKIMRSTCVTAPASIASVVRTLFPDLCASVTWTVHVQGVPVSPDAQVNVDTEFVIEWDCFKPLAPTHVIAASFSLPVDSAQTQMKFHNSPQRWIRSPFRAKAQILRTREDVPVMQIAASFVSHAQLDITLTCHLGSRVIDPTTILKDISTEEVICFKIAPLLGGGNAVSFSKGCEPTGCKGIGFRCEAIQGCTYTSHDEKYHKHGECGPLPFTLPTKNANCAAVVDDGFSGECGPLPCKLPTDLSGVDQVSEVDGTSWECGPLPCKLPVLLDVIGYSDGAVGDCGEYGPLPSKLPGCTTVGADIRTDGKTGECGPLPYKLPGDLPGLLRQMYGSVLWPCVKRNGATNLCLTDFPCGSRRPSETRQFKFGLTLK